MPLTGSMKFTTVQQYNHFAEANVEDCNSVFKSVAGCIYLSYKQDKILFWKMMRSFFAKKFSIFGMPPMSSCLITITVAHLLLENQRNSSIRQCQESDALATFFARAAKKVRVYYMKRSKPRKRSRLRHLLKCLQCEFSNFTQAY